MCTNSTNLSNAELLKIIKDSVIAGNIHSALLTVFFGLGPFLSLGKFIEKSVGSNPAANLPNDVIKVKTLLCCVLEKNGGLFKSNEQIEGVMSEGDKCGPKTIDAIRNFQQTALTFADGRIDPNGTTFHALYLLAANNFDDVQFTEDPFRNEIVKKALSYVGTVSNSGVQKGEKKGWEILRKFFKDAFDVYEDRDLNAEELKKVKTSGEFLAHWCGIFAAYVLQESSAFLLKIIEASRYKAIVPADTLNRMIADKEILDRLKDARFKQWKEGDYQHGLQSYFGNPKSVIKEVVETDIDGAGIKKIKTLACDYGDVIYLNNHLSHHCILIEKGICFEEGEKMESHYIVTVNGNSYNQGILIKKHIVTLKGNSATIKELNKINKENKNEPAVIMPVEIYFHNIKKLIN